MKKSFFLLLALAGIILYFLGILVKINGSAYSALFARISVIGILLFAGCGIIFLIQLLIFWLRNNN